MKLSTILTIALALMFGVSAAMFARRVVLPPDSGSENLEMVSVVVANTDIPRFKTVSAEMLTTRAFPKDVVPPGALLNVEDAIGRTATTTLLKGEAVPNNRLVQRGSGAGMASVIPAGMRAYTVPTPNVATGVAGFILPGNRVDVILTVKGNATDSSGGVATATLMQNVEILAVHQRVDAPAENKVNLKDALSVTLLVTPLQAQTLDLAQAKGTLHLTLRNLQDSDDASTRRITWKELGLIDMQRPEPPPVALVPLPPVIKPVVDDPALKKGPSTFVDVYNGTKLNRVESPAAPEAPRVISPAILDDKKGSNQ